MQKEFYLPLVTVVTPSYNQGEFIEDCILSVKNQSYENIEHIIFDAESPDNTKSILEKYMDQYNMKFYIESDSGQANALNKGFAIAQGEILCWLNCDDYFLHDDVIKNVVEYFNMFQDAQVVTGNGYYVNKDKKWTSPIIFDRHKVSFKHIKHADYILQPSTFWTRSVQVKLNEDLQYTFDWKFFLDLFENNANFLAVNDYLSAYRIYEDNKTALDNAIRKKEIALILKMYFGRISLPYMWALTIYFLYNVSEKCKIPLIKKIARLVNSIMSKITFGRLYSC